MKNMLNKDQVLSSLSWLNKINLNTNRCIIISDAASVLRDVKLSTYQIDVQVPLPWFIIIHLINILSLLRFIPKEFHIKLKEFDSTVEYGYMLGYNIQTMESVIFEHFKTGKLYYKIAHLLGTTYGNMNLFREVEEKLTLQGYICFTPVIYTFDRYKENALLIDGMYYQKLMISDICVIVTPDKIGESTKRRIQQCIEFEIPVYIFRDGQLIEYKE